MVVSGIIRLKKLVDKFDKNKHNYQSMNEENTKIEFINPFFEALDWDVYNKNDYATKFKEVVFEDTIHIGNKAKAPDYSFRIGAEKIFFVEAKKPSVNIKQDKKSAFQIRRYGWSAKLNLCILTNFEELAIYETNTKPDKNQNASIGRIKYYKYTDYVEKWDEIASVFSKNAVLTGDFNNFVTGHQGTKKGTSEVDDEFLKEIEDWRIQLAKNIVKRNKDLKESEDLNYAVQLIIDRIIFLRIAEDRGIEKYEQLKKLLELSNNDKNNYPVYKGFIELCKKADAKYNSGLFHFKKEKGINLADELTPSLKIDDKIFKQIFKNLYYPNCPYEFSVIPTEILGNIYEQFLGAKMRLTPSRRVKIEYKPEVKKAGGVFYTPQYIVDYIVENTIGELLKRKTPNQVSKMKFVDPACGSGTFLLGAFQYLIDWHIKYYSKMKRPPKDVIYTGKDGITRLTVTEKKRIVLNNIYGVDIDTQAVEVSKLSLLLKVLEDSNKDELEAQQKLFQERALPYLGDNIRCGNSLISSDILENEYLSLDEIKKINPFDWEESFKEVFEENGGFDAVIGNPPYFNVDTLGTNSNYKNFLKKHYAEIWEDKTDILFYFIKKANDLSKSEIGYIISNAFLFADKAEKLRNFILNNCPLSKIINFERYEVFKNASINTSIIFLDKNKKDTTTLALDLDKKEYEVNDLLKIINNKSNFFDLKLNRDNVFPIKSKEIINLNTKIDSTYNKLGDLFELGQGMQTGANKVYTFKEFPKEFPKEFIKQRVNVSKIKPYYLPTKGDYLLYCENEPKFKNLPEPIQSYLKENSKSLKNRADKKRRKTSLWWTYTFALHKEYNNLAKIYTNYRNKTNEFALDETSEFIGLTNSTIIFDTNNNLNIKYILAILNSHLFNFRYQTLAKQTGNGSYEYFANSLSKFPIPEINTDYQNKFINFVDKIIYLNEKLATCKTPKEKRLLEKQIEITDKKINQIVYEVYDLTDEEINIIENSLMK